MDRPAVKRIECIVEGRVQGVGYRASVSRAAGELPVTGWIKNQMDGTVKCVAEGEESVLNTLLDLLREGSAVSFVEHIQVNWLESTGEFSTFQIRY